jgi:hypothetical protein
MPKNPFIKAFEDCLEDQIDAIDFEKVSRKYVLNTKRMDEIVEILASSEAIDNKCELLTELKDLYYHFFGIAFEIAVKRGFYLAIRLIFHSLCENQ